MAKMKCDNCNNPATVHLTEIKHGKKIEKHLCEQCAAQNEGLPVKAHTPINELLTNFVLAHSGLQKEGDLLARPGTVEPSWPGDHYSLLRTWESAWGLPTLK